MGSMRRLQSKVIVRNAQSYNRQLHTFEKKLLVAEATKLDEQGKSNSGISWETLLSLEAGADNDATAAAQLKAILNTGADVNPEKQHLLADMAVAEGVVTWLKNQKIQLTWADGTPIVAKGGAVYAFSATAARYKDSTLFNSNLGNATSGDDVGSIPVGWVNQFGPAAALQHQNEIGSIGTSNWQNQNAYQQMSTILGGGIVPVPIDRELLLAMVGGPMAKGVMSLLGELRAARYMSEGADEVLTYGAKSSGQIDSFAVKSGWSIGDDVYNQTAKGNDSSWSTVRSRFWKNEAASPTAVTTYGSENVDRMSKGLAPQRYNADKGRLESMGLSHEPIPARDGVKICSSLAARSRCGRSI